MRPLTGLDSAPSMAHLCECNLHLHRGYAMHMAAKLDDIGRPAWIALTIVSFMIWWPIGLAALAFLIGSGRMGCGCHGHTGWRERRERWREMRDEWRAMQVGRLRRDAKHRQRRVRRIPQRDAEAAGGRAEGIHGLPRPPAPGQGQGRVRPIHDRAPQCPSWRTFQKLIRGRRAAPFIFGRYPFKPASQIFSRKVSTSKRRAPR